jgi:hypothetical protein
VGTVPDWCTHLGRPRGLTAQCSDAGFANAPAMAAGVVGELGTRGTCSTRLRNTLSGRCGICDWEGWSNDCPTTIGIIVKSVPIYTKILTGGGLSVENDCWTTQNRVGRWHRPTYNDWLLSAENRLPPHNSARISLMADGTILANQMKLFHDVADCEPWKQAHDEAMACYAVQDAIEAGLAVWNAITRSNDRGLVTVERAKALCDLHRDWHASAISVLVGIEEMKRKGYDVERSGEFQKTFLTSTSLQSAVDFIRRSVVEVNAGKGLSLDEAMNALRTHSRSERT